MRRLYPGAGQGGRKDFCRRNDLAHLGDLRARLHEYEASTIREMLESVGWNQSEAARRLGMPIRTLSNKVKALGIKRG